MRYAVLLPALVLAAAPFLGAAPAKTPATAPAAVRWVPLEEGAQKVSASGKHLFVSVYTDWCGYCRKLNTVTFKAAPVIGELERNFESVRLNAESEAKVTWKGKTFTSRQLAEHWGVEGYPTLLFLNAKGDIVGSFSSYAEPDLMVKLLTYISSGARERKVSFEDFVRGRG
jgi:thioredoxin-related protein